MKESLNRDGQSPVAAPGKHAAEVPSWRGFMLDEARHFFGKDAVKALLDRMAAAGLNVFHWHLTDDQGWRIDLPGMPELARFGAVRPSSPLPGEDCSSDGTRYGPFFYTVDDIREIVAYAAARGIGVVPEIDLPGHTRALLAAHPEFACEGVELPRAPLCTYGVCEDVLCAGSDEAVAFCERVLDAVCDLFPAAFVHVGGDECPKTRWKACPRCQSRIRAEGLADETALQGWFMRRIVEHLAKRGRRAVGWNEILHCGDLPASTVVQVWHGDAAAEAAAAARKGHDVILSPLRETYLSIPEGLPGDPYRYRAWVLKGGWTIPVQRIRSFNPFSYLPGDLAHRVLGGECCAWTEVIQDRAELEYKVLNRLAAFGDAINDAVRPAVARPGVIDITVTQDGIRECRMEGFADIEGRRPMAMDTLLWMASTGKVVTAVAFMTLVDAGLVALDDPAWKYLPHFRHLYRALDPEHPNDGVVPLETTVTLRHLLSHTSGLQWLPGFFQNRELTYISLETQTHVYAASPFLFEPGTSWSYSNAGINTIGRVIEVVTGKRYEDFMQETIFGPLGMADTGYHPTSAQVARRAYGYAYDREAGAWKASEVTNQMSLIPYDGPNRHAECGGGLFSTAADMARFAQMIAAGGVFDGRRIVSEAALREICRRQTAPGVARDYGLGCQVGTVGHGGAWGTQMSVDLDRREGTLHLVQKTGKWPEDYAAEERKTVGNAGTY